MIGGGLLLLAFILFAIALLWRRPQLGPRSRLQIAQPAALLQRLTQGRYHEALAGNEQIAKVAGAARRNSRPALLGTFTLALVVGLIAGRRL
jgi:hypothetical protein